MCVYFYRGLLRELIHKYNINGSVCTTHISNNSPMNFVSIPTIKAKDKKVQKISAASHLKLGFFGRIIEIFSNENSDNFAV